MQKIARAAGGHKKFMLTKLGGGGGVVKQNRSQFHYQNQVFVLSQTHTNMH